MFPPPPPPPLTLSRVESRVADGFATPLQHSRTRVVGAVEFVCGVAIAGEEAVEVAEQSHERGSHGVFAGLFRRHGNGRPDRSNIGQQANGHRRT